MRVKSEIDDFDAFALESLDNSLLVGSSIGVLKTINQN